MSSIVFFVLLAGAVAGSAVYWARNKKKRANVYWSYLYAIIGVIIMTPIYYLLVTTFKSSEEATRSPMGLPDRFTLVNYANALAKTNYGQALKNNAIIVVFAVLFLIIFSSMAAYSIVKGRKWYHKLMFSVFMVGLIVPFQITIFPLFKIMAPLKLVDNLLGVIILDVFCINMALSIFLFKGFINTIPSELEEAAAIDGCSVFMTFWRIIFPLFKPVIATVGILDALAVWNDFMTPLMFLPSPRNYVLLQEVSKNVGQFQTDWASLFPMLVLAVLPMVVIYIALQKYIIEGVVAGAVKG